MEGYVTQRQFDELLQVFQDLCAEKGASWLARVAPLRGRTYLVLRRAEVMHFDGAVAGARPVGWRCSDCHQVGYHARVCETAQLLLAFGPDDEMDRQAACAWPAALREVARRAGPRAVPRADGGTTLVWDHPDGDD